MKKTATMETQTLKTRAPAMRKPSISGHTWELIKQKQEARGNEDYTKELALRKEAKQAAGKDKLAFGVKQFRELQGAKEGWADLR